VVACLSSVNVCTVHGYTHVQSCAVDSTFSYMYIVYNKIAAVENDDLSEVVDIFSVELSKICFTNG
jgi:hypothetical protein